MISILFCLDINGRISSESDSSESQSSEQTSSSTDESDESDDEDIHHDEIEFVNGPLYPGAQLTVAESLISILLFYIRHDPKDVCLADLLRLITLHCPPGSRCVKSIYYMEKMLSQDAEPPTRHFYCRSCYNPLLNASSACDACQCSEEPAFFLSLSIKSQLQKMYQRPGFCDLLNYRFTRKKINVENLEDIPDGMVHRHWSQPGAPLSIPENISFFWNTDEFSPYNSSDYGITPFYLTCNELPPLQRYKQENLIMAGLWFGKAKPQPNLFMSSFSDEIEELFNGVDFKLPEPGVTRHVQGFVIGGTCDLVAKAPFLNMQKFNGKFGCALCKSICKHIKNVPTYAYPKEMTLRTTEETRAAAQVAHDSNVHQEGVKGPSALDFFVYDYVCTTAVDDMHCVYLGTAIQLLTLITDEKYKEKPWSLNHKLDVLEARLASAKPPNFVHRLPREIVQLKKWKAAESKSYLLFYALAIFYELLPHNYYEHFKLLVVGVYLLSTRSVSENDINLSEKLLHQFVKEMHTLYGPRHMLPNTHQLLHLPLTCRKFGPLPMISCFHYEDFNGKLKAMIHGTRHPEKQIVSRASLLMNMATFRERYLVEGSKTHKFCDRMMKPNQRRKLIHVSDEFKIVGLLKVLVQVPIELNNLLLRNGLYYTKIQYFNRLMQNRVYFETVDYERTVRTNSTCVQFVNQESKEIGIFQRFLELSLCECDGACEKTENCGTRYFAIISKLDTNVIPLKTVDDVDFEYGFRCWNSADYFVVDIEETEFTPCYYTYLEDIDQAFAIVSTGSVRDK